jgi:hypothetical protein
MDYGTPERFVLFAERLTRFDSGQSCEKGNGIENTFSSFKSTRSKNPCRDRMDNEYVEKETGKP